MRNKQAHKRSGKGVETGVSASLRERQDKKLSKEDSVPMSRAEKHKKELSRIVMWIISGAGLLTLIQIAIPAPVDQWIMDQKVRSVDADHVIATMNKKKGAIYGIVSISGPVEYNAAVISIPVTGLKDWNTHYNCPTRQFTQYVANIARVGSFVPEVACLPWPETDWIRWSKD